MGKVVLDQNKCIGCGACMSIAPDNFTFDDEGRSTLVSDEVTSEAVEASEMCPVSAISIEGCIDCDSTCDCGCNEGKPCSCDCKKN